MGETSDQLFEGVVALFVEHGLQQRRLQVWKQKLEQRGGVIRQHMNRSVTHVFAADFKFLQKRFGRGRLEKLRKVALNYEWLEDSLKAGHAVPLEPYLLIKLPLIQSMQAHGSPSRVVSDENMSNSQLSSVDMEESSPARRLYEEHAAEENDVQTSVTSDAGGSQTTGSQIDLDANLDVSSQTSPELTYSPPNLNKNITDIFEELRTIYGDALGDDRRSFSYRKASSVLEKVDFKITSSKEVKGLPSIGKSMQDHIDEILKTGTSAKLDYFKNDEKVRAISQFAEVWGIGPSIARKLYEKGHRTLSDLVGEESLTVAQKIGLKFNTDINRKIPRHEVQEMETLVREWAQSIDQDVIVICGGSYRRGKAFVGDMDFVLSHPDGESHIGFLRKLVQKLKDSDFLTEDLLIGMNHSAQERGVDTYFGLCKYPGREWRHRIDFKVYPYEKFPFGLVAWTGNDVLNRRLRIQADRQGYKMDDHGCFPVTVDASGEKMPNRSCSVPCKSERDVFDFLGFSWLEPHERNL